MTTKSLRAKAGLLGCCMFIMLAGFLTSRPVVATAQGTEAVHIHSYKIDGGYVLVNSGVGYLTHEDTTAYCFDYTKHGPGDSGQSYTDIRNGTFATDYLLAKGYPETTYIAKVQWDAPKAQAVTQLAAWLLSGTVEASSPELSDIDDAILAAAKTFCQEARAYQGGDPSIDGTSSVYYVAGKPEVQAMLAAARGGRIVLKKTSANVALTVGNNQYSLAGATYGVFDADGTKVSEFETDNQGHGVTNDVLPAGTYTVKELVAPPGYILSSKVHRVVVRNGDVSLAETEEPVLARLTLVKRDAETGDSGP